MKSVRLLFACCFLLSASLSFAQSIRGKVYRKGTTEVIPGASVYYNGSMGGTSTDENGEFSLKATPGKMPVIISCLGYYSAVLSDYSFDQHLEISLDPKVTSLKTVRLVDDGMSREDKIKSFYQAFVGTSDFAKSCVIKNIDDIELYYHKKTKTLTAFCSDPILLENKKLGYFINYFLDSFTDSSGRTRIIGNFAFKESRYPEAKTVNSNRNKVYNGSRQEFVRALWNNTLEDKGYKMYNHIGQPVSAQSLAAPGTLTNKLLFIKGQIIIEYKKSKYTYLSQNTPVSVIGKNGYFDANLHWVGAMGQQRIGDLLPYDYYPDDEHANAANDTIGEIKNVRLDTALSFPQAAAALPGTSPPVKVNGTTLGIFENTYLHTDRELYAGGEDIWFQAYLLNGQTGVLAATSTNLYAELIGPSGTITERKVIRLDGGLGNGDFHLADTIAAGTYRLRAYTSWMRNFGDHFIFEKNVRIVNNRDPQVQPVRAGKGNKGGDLIAPPSPPLRLSVQPPEDPPAPLLRFFPESGALIDGVPSVVGFRSESISGKGLAAKGGIFTVSGTQVTSFSCDSAGMGSFLLKTAPGEHYTAKGTFANGSLFSVPLPAALLQGFSFSVQSPDSLLHISIGTNAATLMQQREITVVLLAKSKGKTVYSAHFQLSGLQSAFTLAKSKFPAGILSLVLYDLSGKPQCERLVYIEGKEQVNLTITPDKTVYAPKGKVTLTLKATNQQGFPVNAHLSLAAVNAGLIPVNSRHIVSYLDLTSEIKGEIQDPDQYFDPKNPGRWQRLDNLLLTQGWRDFTWKQLADSALRVTYPLEQGTTISGKVVNKQKPVAGANVTLTANGAASNKLFFSTTDTAGRFYFNNIQIYGQQTLKLVAKDYRDKSPVTVQMDSLFQQALPVEARKGPTEPDSYPEKTFEKETMERSRKISLSDTLRLKEIAIKTRSLVQLFGESYITFGYKDEVFNITPKDYDHENLLHYLVHYSKGTPSGTGIYYDGFRVDPRSSRFARIQVSPRMIANGRPMNPAVIYNLPMNKVQKVVIRHLIDKSNRDAYFIFCTVDPSVFTPQAADQVTATVNGYYQARTFFTPVYEAPSTLTDLRTTIHWQPGITTDEKGEATLTYYNADPSTTIRVTVEGITANGIPVTASTVYQVK